MQFRFVGWLAGWLAGSACSPSWDSTLMLIYLFLFGLFTDNSQMFLSKHHRWSLNFYRIFWNLYAEDWADWALHESTCFFPLLSLKQNSIRADSIFESAFHHQFYTHHLQPLHLVLQFDAAQFQYHWLICHFNCTPVICLTFVSIQFGKMIFFLFCRIA